MVTHGPRSTAPCPEWRGMCTCGARAPSLAHRKRVKANYRETHGMHNFLTSFKALQAREARRRRYLKRSVAPRAQVLFSLRGTLLLFVLWDWVFWFCIVLYLVIRLLLINLPEGSVPESTEVDTTVVGSSLAFFLIFYVAQSYTRFDKAYKSAMSIEGQVFNAAAMARCLLPKTAALRLVRHLNAMMCLGFCGIDHLYSTYSAENLFYEYNDRFHVLTEEELHRLKVIGVNKGGNCYREVAAPSLSLPPWTRHCGMRTTGNLDGWMTKHLVGGGV